MKTTVGAVCFVEEKAKKNAEVIEQVSKRFNQVEFVLMVDSASSSSKV